MNLYDRLFSGDIDTLVFPENFGIDELLTYGMILLSDNNFNIEVRSKTEIADIKDDPKYLMINIGGGELDSTQAFFDINDNGHKLTAFSKLWQLIGEDVVGFKELADVINNILISVIDDHITGRVQSDMEFNLVDIAKYFLPEWNEEPINKEKAPLTFFHAGGFITIALERLVNHYSQIDKAIDLITELASNCTNGILVLDKYIPVAQKTVEQINTDLTDKVYFIVHPNPKHSEKYTFTATLVNGSKKCVAEKSDITDKDALVDYLLPFMEL